MDLKRVLRHLFLPDWWSLRAFPDSALRAIGEAVARSERQHGGELRIVIESSLPVSLLRGRDASHRRALELFSRLGVWDTAQNSGVLIYLQLNDRCVEIVADRGINACVEADFWSGVCRRMEEAFREGRHEQGVLCALHEISSQLAFHFPPQGENPNELPDAPLVP